MDDFGIKYDSEDDLDHLINTLKKYYSISIDKTGTNYCELTFELRKNYPWKDKDM